jgi:activator of HSP90 ATPase
MVGAYEGSRSSLSSTRRQWMVGSALTVGGLMLTPPNSWAATDNGLSHGAEAIHQEVTFEQAPKRVYAALTDAQQFQKVVLLSGASKQIDVTSKPAGINREPGGEFSIFGGYIVGRQLELVPNQRLVQAWRERTWAPGVYSVVRFELSEQAAGTKLVFDHTGFPAGAGDHLAIGWKLNYWEPLAKFLAGRA